jgi:hypothetical protein
MRTQNWPRSFLHSLQPMESSRISEVHFRSPAPSPRRSCTSHHPAPVARLRLIAEGVSTPRAHDTLSTAPAWPLTAGIARCTHYMEVVSMAALRQRRPAAPPGLEVRWATHYDASSQLISIARRSVLSRNKSLPRAHSIRL